MRASSTGRTAAAAAVLLVMLAGSAHALCLTGEEVYDTPGQFSQKTPDHCAVCAVPPGSGMMAPEGRPAAALRTLPLMLRPAAPGATSTARLAPCPPPAEQAPAG